MSLTKQMNDLIPPNTRASDIAFVCIGTDRSTGDALGPLVGSYLEELGYNVIGTVDNPAHGMNLQERLEEVQKGKVVVAIDASLGHAHSVGESKFRKGSMRPGAGVNRDDLPRVGDYHISGIVNVGGFMEYYVLQNTRLSLVMKMAREIVGAISEVIPLNVSPFQEIAATGDSLDCFVIHEDEMADIKNQQVEEMIERLGGSLDEHYNKSEKGECEHGNYRN